jgi:xanthine phosphoribosyltransferase
MELKKNLRLLACFLIAVIVSGNTNALVENNMEKKQLKAAPLIKELSWEEVKGNCEKLAQKLSGTQWAGIVAITRGGLFPAGLLSQYLPIRTIKTINVKSYEGKSQKEMTIIDQAKLDHEGKDWLIVDDISDSGSTFAAIKKIYPQATYISVYVKPKGKSAATHFAEEVPQDLWLQFPWEIKE